MSAAVEGQAVNSRTLRALRYLRKNRLPPHWLMSDVSLLQDSYDVQVLRGLSRGDGTLHLWKFDNALWQTGRPNPPATVFTDHVVAGFRLYSWNACVGIYHALVGKAYATGSKRISIDDLTHAIRDTYPGWADERVMKVRNFIWFQIANTAGWESSPEALIGRMLEAKQGRDARAAQKARATQQA